jgi:hypothetical protein
MWLPDEPAVYVGMAGTSLRTRLGQFYSTRLGARSPHAGGWAVRCMGDLSQAWVRFGECTDAKRAEREMLQAFMAAVTLKSRVACLTPSFRCPTRTWRLWTPPDVAESNATASKAPKLRADWLLHNDPNPSGGTVRMSTSP